MTSLSGRRRSRPDLSRPRRLRRVILVLCLALVALAAVPVLLLAYAEHRLSENLTRVDGVFDGLPERPSEPPGAAAGAVDILVMGTDRRADASTTGTAAREAAWVPGAQRSDTLMLVHVDADRRRVAAVSIPRDTWVDVPGFGKAKINAAYSYGGPRLAVATVERFTGVRVDHVAIVDWSGFVSIVDSMGGVDVDVPRTVTDSARGVTWVAGEHHLDGTQALAYAGQRYGLPLGDLDRVARQQLLLRTLAESVRDRGLLQDPRRVYHLLDVVTRHLTVDSEWSLRDIAGLLLSLRNVEVADVDLLTLPVAGFGTVAGQSVVFAAPDAAGELWRAVVADRVGSWAERHPQYLTPSTVR